MKEMSQLTKKGVRATKRHDWSPILGRKGSSDVHLIVMHMPLQPTMKLFHCLLTEFFSWNRILHHNPGWFPTLWSSCPFYSCLFPFPCVCIITCMWSLCIHVCSEVNARNNPWFFSHIIHWAWVSQSNLELGIMTVFPSQLALGIPCILFPGLELQTATTPTWHIVWVFGIWTLLLTRP